MDSLFSVRLLIEIAFKQMIKSVPKFIGSYFLSGPIGFLLSEFTVKVFMQLYNAGILKIDFDEIDKKVDLQKLEFKDAIKKAHDKAKKKALTENEKEAIRQEYQKALAKFGYFSAG